MHTCINTKHAYLAVDCHYACFALMLFSHTRQRGSTYAFLKVLTTQSITDLAFRFWKGWCFPHGTERVTKENFLNYLLRAPPIGVDAPVDENNVLLHGAMKAPVVRF